MRKVAVEAGGASELRRGWGRRAPWLRLEDGLRRQWRGGAPDTVVVDLGQRCSELDENDDGEMNEVKMEKSPYLTIYRLRGLRLVHRILRQEPKRRVVGCATCVLGQLR